MWRFRKEGTSPQCTRCGREPMGSLPDGLVYGCDDCRQPGDKIHGSDPLRDYCVGCGTGLPAAKPTGGMMFDKPGDEKGTWWCEPCDEIECVIEDLEAASEAVEVAQEAARIANACYEELRNRKLEEK